MCLPAGCIGAAGVLDLNGNADGVGNLNTTAGGLVVNDSNNNATFTIGYNNGTGTAAGLIENNNNSGATAGTLALTK